MRVESEGEAVEGPAPTSWRKDLADIVGVWGRGLRVEVGVVVTGVVQGEGSE